MFWGRDPEGELLVSASSDTDEAIARIESAFRGLRITVTGTTTHWVQFRLRGNDEGTAEFLGYLYATPRRRVTRVKESEDGGILVDVERGDGSAHE